MSPSQAIAAVLLQDVREAARAASSSQHASIHGPRKMSDPGPSEYVKSSDLPVMESLERVGPGDTNATVNYGESLPRSANTLSAAAVAAEGLPATRMNPSTQTKTPDRAPIRMRVHFQDFAQQLRMHRHHEHKNLVLQHRRACLQKAVALSTRLQRVCSWIHDGLVEISGHNDPGNFVRVQQHMQDLVDTCFAHWQHEVQAIDSIGMNLESGYLRTSPSFVSRLSLSSRTSCLRFIHSVRSSPRFLIERFKLVTPSQLAALSTSPKFQDMSTTFLTSLSQSHGQSSQKKRIKSYSKGLEEYATSFERSNPLSFLLFNCYSSPAGSNTKDDQLRLFTWSNVCAGLLQESWPSFQVLIKQALSGFSNINQWAAKDRIELFLMDTLQRGAFLLDFGEDDRQLSVESVLSDSLETDLAKDFFDNAVRDLFGILYDCGSGIPQGSLDLGCAILGQLPTEQLQSDFRGYMFWEWFLCDFLRILITYPENEKMLLRFHISKRARSHILHQLWTKAWNRATQLVGTSPQSPIDMETKFYVESIISVLCPKHSNDPYASGPPSKANTDSKTGVQDATKATEVVSNITICAADIVQVLEALSPQSLQTSMNSWDRFIKDTTNVFNSQYEPPSSWIDKLRRELLVITEPGSSTKNVHPWHEDWTVLSGDENGTLRLPPDISIPETTFSYLVGNMDIVQQAAIRILDEEMSWELPIALSTIEDESWNISRALAPVFVDKIGNAYKASDHVSMHYWETAKRVLDLDYPLSRLVHDDSKVLRPLIQKSQQRLAACLEESQDLDFTISALEAKYAALRTHVIASCERLNKLRVKMWYKVDVVNSNAYEDARNIAQALNYMVLSRNAHLGARRSPDEMMRDGTNTPSSSILDQSRNNTVDILKASAEHGGSTKLADSQIELIRRWMDRQSIENFCKGEERIHRFCMEIKTATRKLVGETISESPVLWSSELWSREKDLFEMQTTIPTSIHGGTRPPSVFSETFPSSLYSLRPPSRVQEGSIRSLDTDISGSPARKASFHSLGSARINRGLLGKDLASSLASPGRSSATTAESITSVWSTQPSQTRSMTSISIHSQPPSIYNDFVQLRIMETGQEKTRFLENLQQELTSLLLSDLGNPVWSRGSETDAWIGAAKMNANINRRIAQRKVLDKLVSVPIHNISKTSSKTSRPKARRKRSISFDSAHSRHPNSGARIHEQTRGQVHLQPEDLAKFQDLLQKISQQVDPSQKLQAINELKQLATAVREVNQNLANLDDPASNASIDRLRRKSVPSVAPASPQSAKPSKVATPIESSLLKTQSEDDIVNYLRNLLLELQPTTLFRDLQYIASFVPSETLNKTESGRAFLHLGLAALGYKDDICRSMVDLADSIVIKDSIKRTKVLAGQTEEPLIKARDYWVLAAREGNAIAQRELAGLYLAHPSVPPVVTLPLITSKSIFRPEMMWEQPRSAVTNQSSHHRALCLALYWMQQAANNGDSVAISKMNERQSLAT